LSRIIVDERYCKGCGLCITVCPKDIIVLDPDRITDKGYHPAMLTDDSQCTACANCAVICPDVAITVERS
jgi:2-oxoglutarate ferredoxin oxidoreductase subunit delta